MPVRVFLPAWFDDSCCKQRWRRFSEAQFMKCFADLPSNETAHQLASKLVAEEGGESKEIGMQRRRYGKIVGMAGETKGRMAGWLAGWMDRWMDGWMWERIRKGGNEIEPGKIPNSCNSKQITACGHFYNLLRGRQVEMFEMVRKRRKWINCSLSSLSSLSLSIYLSLSLSLSLSLLLTLRAWLYEREREREREREMKGRRQGYAQP